MFRGRFYFRLTTSGNLLGEFSHQLSSFNHAHSAERWSGGTDSFVGTYVNVRFVNGNKMIISNLEISLKKETIGIFTLAWSDDANTLYFTGEGFVVDGLLIGDYIQVN